MAIVTVDFDGTLYQGNSFKAMFKAGKKRFSTKQWAVFSGGLMKATVSGLIHGKLKFQHESFKAFVKTFKGQTNIQLDEFFLELVNYGKEEVNQDLVSQILEHQNNGDTLIILSGALEPFLKAFTKELQLDLHIISTELLFNQNGLCSGEIGQIVNGATKVKKLQEWIEQKQIPTSQIWAYCDSRSDIPLLKYVTHPVVVNPKEDMLKVAEQNKWKVFGS